MVSTRGVKVKFSEGERVLCYEPDPTKAKVLYDSKVLDVVFGKDNKGRKQVEYLIHFQGWNASWDRCVAEDFVLKDTDENRELQRQLADKAHIKLSIKSNRVLLWGPSYSKEKRRKRRLSETIRETIEKAKKDQQEESETSSQTGTTITDEEMGSGASEVESNTTGLEEEDEEDEEEDVEEEEETSDEETFQKYFPIAIPENLKSVLAEDHVLINEKNKLLDLPTHRTALNLLESYVRFFAVRYFPRTKERRRSEVKDRDKNFLTLDLCKEVMDGVRICFDFHIETHLLYGKELKQAEKLRSAKPIVIKGEPDEAQDLLLQVEERDNELPICNKEEMEMEEIKPKPEKEEDEKTKGTEASGRRQLRSKRPLSGESSSTVEKEKLPSLPPPPQTCESGRSTPTTITSGTSIAGASGLGSTDMGCIPLYETVQPQLQDWTLLPDTHRDPPPPSLIYGPLHLIRLFVKLPEVLYRMNLPEIKRKIILKHIELFLEYVSNHSKELFSESHYMANPYV